MVTDLRDELNQCAFCGGRGSFEAPLTWSTWGFGFVSDPFPAHRSCAEDYGTDALKEQP